MTLLVGGLSRTILASRQLAAPIAIMVQCGLFISFQRRETGVTHHLRRLRPFVPALTGQVRRIHWLPTNRPN